MKKRVLLITVVACLVVYWVANGQEAPNNWPIANTRFVPLPIGQQYQVNSNGSHIFSYLGTIINVDDTNIKYLVSTGVLPMARWLNGTIAFREQEWLGSPAPECSTLDMLAIGFYNAGTDTYELFCLDSPQEMSSLERNPYDDYTLLIDNRYLLNIQNGSRQDLQNALTTQIAAADTMQWFAHGRTWWSPITKLPMARVGVTTEGTTTGLPEITNQSLWLCPMASENCHLIVSVQDHVHGSLADAILSPDGQTLLWSAFVYPVEEEIPPGNAAAPGIVEDVWAFATNIQDGATQEIFRLSDHNPSTAKGIQAIWSTDGKTLAVSMQAAGTNIEEDGALIATFSGPNLVSILQGSVWLDANQDGLQTPEELVNTVSGITVNLYDGLGALVATTATDAAGSYQFEISPGLSYRLQFLAPGYTFSPANAGSDDALDSDVDPATGYTETIILATNQTDSTWDVGLDHPIATTATLQTQVETCVTDRGLRALLNTKVRDRAWQAFIDNVEAQRGKKITEDCAADLIEMATYLRDNPQ